MFLVFFFFKQKTAYEMRISDWSSDVCSSDLRRHDDVDAAAVGQAGVGQRRRLVDAAADLVHDALGDLEQMLLVAELDRRDLELALFFDQLGRASRRERVDQYLSLSLVAVPLKKKPHKSI